MSRSRARRLPLRTALLGSVLGALLAAAPAAGHVSVSPGSAASGTTPSLTFRVPNERPVPTTSVRIVIPDTAPIPTARPEEKPGWTTAIETEPLTSPVTVGGVAVTEVVRSVSWSGGEIPVGGDDRFTVTLGPLPTGEEILFRAVQTYADGEVVRWNQPPEPDGSEPERPAPQLTVTPGTGPATTAVPTTTTVAEPTTVPGPTPTSSATAEGDSAGNPALLILVALGAVAIVAVGAVAVGHRRTRS